MPRQIHRDELRGATELLLGESPPCVLDPVRLAEFARATALQRGDPAAPPAVPSEGEEVEPFWVLALVPPLLEQTVQITGVTDQVLVAIEKVRLVSEVPAGAEFRLRAVLAESSTTREGHLLCRIGVSIHVGGSEFPAIIAELLMLAGSPGATESEAGGAGGPSKGRITGRDRSARG